jgi:hypothetical protein
VCSSDLQARNNTISVLGDRLHGFLSLESLDLGENQLTAVLEDTFHGLANLTTLILSENRISAVHANAFARAPALATLLLDGNLLSWLDGRTFQNCGRLQFLNVGLNQITSLPAELVLRNNALTILQLDGNRLSLVPAYGHLALLQKLWLSENSIESLPAPLRFPHLTSLRLSNNRLSAWPSLSGCPKLASLQLSHAWNVPELDAEEDFSLLQHLGDLQIIGVVLNDSQIQQISNLSGLRDLAVGGSWLCDFNQLVGEHIVAAHLHSLRIEGTPCKCMDVPFDMDDGASVIIEQNAELERISLFAMAASRDNIALEYLSFRNNPKLAHVSSSKCTSNSTPSTFWPDSRFLVISNTSLPYSPLFCTYLGSFSLIAQHINHSAFGPYVCPAPNLLCLPPCQLPMPCLALFMQEEHGTVSSVLLQERGLLRPLLQPTAHQQPLLDADRFWPTLCAGVSAGFTFGDLGTSPCTGHHLVLDAGPGFPTAVLADDVLGGYHDERGDPVGDGVQL